MRLKIGTKVLPIILPDINGAQFDLETLTGKPYMISFYRFASCPFCNLRLHQLISRSNELGPEFHLIAIFDSPIDNLRAHAKSHQAPFPILADQNNIFYKKYGIEHSIVGIFKGMIFRMPTLLKGMLKGYLPIKIKGRLSTMPADFLVDRQGVIQEAYYGKDEGDHLSFDAVKLFSQIKQGLL